MKPNSDNPLPLHGIKVVEAGQVLAGPFAGAILADLGAEVIKVERPEGGDDSRMMGGPFKRGDAINFHVYNRGKKSVAIDLKTPEGLADFHALVQEADIFVHNLRPGVVEALGIDGASLCERYSRLIYCEISGFGHKGPARHLPSYEALIEAYSGLFSINGGPDDPPMRIGVSICDLGSGMWAAIAALGLLQRRQVTGRGGVAATSLLETAFVWAGQKIDALANQGTVPEKHASGTHTFVPYQAFDTRDGAIVICAGNDRLFAKLASALGHPEWIQDERFNRNRSRLVHKAQLVGMMQEILATDTRAAWSALLQRAGVPCSPIHSLAEAIAQPQFAELGLAREVPGDGFSLLGLPISFDGDRPDVRRPAPALGQHDDEIASARARAAERQSRASGPAGSTSDMTLAESSETKRR